MTETVSKILTGKAVLLTAVTTLGLATAAPQPAFAENTMRIGFVAGEDDEDFDGAMVLKDFVESRTNGSITVEICPGAQFCGNFRECLESVQTGTLEVTMSTIGGFGNLFPQGQVMDVPYMFRDDRVAECVF